MRDAHSTLRKKLGGLQRIIQVDNEQLSGRVSGGEGPSETSLTPFRLPRKGSDNKRKHEIILNFTYEAITRSLEDGLTDICRYDSYSGLAPDG